MSAAKESPRRFGPVRVAARATGILGRLAFAGLLVASLAGCPPREPVETAITAGQETLGVVSDLTLGPGDVFDVRVFNEADLTGTYRVNGDGTIDFPLIGQVRVEGLDPHTVGTLLEGKLRERFLRQPQVSVIVKELNSKKITVLGQVTKPGSIPYTPNMTVIEAISVANGFTPLASKNKSTLTRIEGGKKTVSELPLGDIEQGKAPNVPLRPGDLISVPERIF